MKDEAEIWVCGECRRPEDGRLTVNYVCHHCGTLLCTRHKIELPDVAFRGRVMSLPAIAVHCHKCAEAHHHVVLPPRR
jgi:hypothetical protein